MKFKIVETRNRQRGFALILAIGFLAILSILGAVVMDVATRDLSGTRDTLPNQQALQAAERSIEYLLNEDVRSALIDSPEIEYNSPVMDAGGAPVIGVTHEQVINSTGPGRIISGKIKSTFVETLPPDMVGINSLNSAGRFFQASVKTSPNNSSGGVFTAKNETHIDANLLQVLPKAGGQNVTVTTKKDL